MPKKPQKAKPLEATAPAKRSVGRPSTYKPEFCEQVTRFCRVVPSQSDNEGIARFLGVATSSVSKWKTEHPEFSDAIKEGKDGADVEVGNALYKNATGGVVEVEKWHGKGDDRKLVKQKVYIQPDTTAAIFWLKNRKSKDWRDKHDIDATLKGDADNPIVTRIELIAPDHGKD